MRLITSILLVMLASSVAVSGQHSGESEADRDFYIPKLFGGVKTRFETALYDGSSRFAVRNARLGVTGNAGRAMRYQLQADYSNDGKFSVLDAYAVFLLGRLELSLGQQQYKFSTDFDRGPLTNIFANRSFLGKYLSTYYDLATVDGQPVHTVRTLGTRDIGVLAKYRLEGIPLKASFGIFNGSGINNPQWSRRPAFSGRIEAGREYGFAVAASHYNGRTPASAGVDSPLQDRMVMWGGELRFNRPKYRIEAEYAQRRLKHEGLHVLHAAHVLGHYKFDMDCDMLDYIAPVGRWDMGRDIEFVNRDGNMEKFSANRATVGVNFGFDGKLIRSEIRLQFEKYFPDGKPSDYAANPLLQDKLTVEFVATF